ncbi:MAG: Hsp20/alpha crystallin family protein [Caldisericia bacterium]|jgi:HSP20 family protein|nr:Hsp20/alpha crystallin family protein [Caldisericia bacterium]
MAIRRWEPWDIDIFSDFEKLRREIDRMFEEFIPLRREREITFRPSIDLIETDNEVILKAELPGLKKDNIEITVTEDEVHLKGEKKEETETKKENYLRKEICYGKFERVISLPAEVDPEKVEAEFKDGVLEIKMPKKEEAKRKIKKIELK